MSYNVSKFAKNQLRQSGWVEGKGLGRNEDGMSEAIKVKIKADNAGIGHDPAEQFTFHWWEHAFTKSAQNIKVTECAAGVEVEVKSETEKASTRKQNKRLLKQKLLYGSFVKSGVLEHGEIQKSPTARHESDSSDSEPEKPKISKILTDEELLAACGGRTAHKGARHGVNLSAKLARLQEQEMFDATAMPKKKKKKRKKEGRSSSDNIQSPALPIYKTDSGASSSEPKKKKKHKENTERPDDVEVPSVKTEKTTKKGKKRSKQNRPPVECDNMKKTVDFQGDEPKVKKKKKKRKSSLTEIDRND